MFNAIFRIALPIALACLAPPLACAADDTAETAWVPLTLSVPKAAHDAVMAMPKVTAVTGFNVSTLVAPGSPLYDPFDIYIRDEKTLWVADDSRGGTIYQVTRDGVVKVLAESGQHPPISIDVAPPSFGPHAGYIYAVAFAKPEKIGGWQLPNAITRFDPKNFAEEVVCFLPKNAAGEDGAGSFFGRFGPEGSPFAGKFFITAGTNSTIYVLTPDDQCKPFAPVDRARWGAPRGIAFTPDGKTMLVGAAIQNPQNPAITTPGKGSIMRVWPDGTIAAEPFATGLHEPGAMAFAPDGFGSFAGELFISDAGNWDNDIQETDPITPDGTVYRIPRDGTPQVFATGFLNPVGVVFHGKTLVLSDINGDFHVGQHKIPIGFMVTVDYAR